MFWRGENLNEGGGWLMINAANTGGGINGDCPTEDKDSQADRYLDGGTFVDDELLPDNYIGKGWNTKISMVALTGWC